MAELDEKRVLELVKLALREEKSPLEIVEECRQGLKVVGERYSCGEYFLSDLIMSAEIFQEVLRALEPYLPISPPPQEQPNKADIVFGTV